MPAARPAKRVPRGRRALWRDPLKDEIHELLRGDQRCPGFVFASRSRCSGSTAASRSLMTTCRRGASAVQAHAHPSADRLSPRGYMPVSGIYGRPLRSVTARPAGLSAVSPRVRPSARMATRWGGNPPQRVWHGELDPRAPSPPRCRMKARTQQLGFQAPEVRRWNRRQHSGSPPTAGRSGPRPLPCC
jgi:hypothetical protein